MKRLHTAVIVILFCSTSAMAQSIGPLQQMMGSHSLIDRPLVFRELHGRINEAIRGTKPGVKLDVIGSMVERYKQRLTRAIDRVTAEATDGVLSIRFPANPGVYSVKLADYSKLQEAIDKVTNLPVMLEAAALRGADEPAELSPTVAYAVFAFLKNSGVFVGLNSVTSENPGIDDVLKSIKKTLSEGIKAKLQDEFSDDTRNAAPNSERQAVRFAEIINEELTAVRDRFATCLDLAEEDILQSTTSTEQWRLSGNTGVSVAETGGEFAGGLMATFTEGNHFQLGAYVGGISGKPDTVTNYDARSLVALQIRFACDLFQAEFALAKFIGADLLHVWEFAAGMSWRVSTGIIAGISAFGLTHNAISLAASNLDATYGITIKGASATSPSILIGSLVRKGQKSQPVLQVSLPINASR